MGRSRRGRRRGSVRNLVLILAILGLSGVSGTMYLRQRVSQTYAEDNTETVASETVERGSLTTTVPGSGTLEASGICDVTVPSGVEISRIFYEQGDEISEGDLLFSVDTASVLNRMKSVQEQMDALDKSLEEAGSDEVPESLTSGVSGRIKKIYASEGDDVSSVMYENGALAVLSLDGYMAVDIATEQFPEGEEVIVTTSAGESYTGTVDHVTGGIATILLTDDGPEEGENVTVRGTEEDAGGDAGTLYIHSPLSITGYAGTVESVNVCENESIDADASILTLTDTSYSANYNRILSQRTELEETLQVLITLYREGGVYAETDGWIDSISEEYEDDVSPGLTSGGSGEEAQADNIAIEESDRTASADTTDAAQTNGTDSGESTVLTLDPGKQMTISVSVDESNILSMETGLKATVTIDSIGDDTYEGTVTDIDTASVSASGVSTYLAEVTIDRTAQMRSGMSASVTIVIDGTENALLVSAQAVHQTSSASYVYTECDESGTLGGMVEVTTGITDGSRTEILSGLEEGDVVYYEQQESSDDPFSGHMSGMDGFGSAGSFFGTPGGSSGGSSSGMPGGSSGGSSSGMPGGSSGGSSSGMPGGSSGGSSSGMPGGSSGSMSGGSGTHSHGG